MTRCTKRATTAIALLAGNQLHLARAGTAWESRAAQIPSDFRASVIAIDGPLLPQGADNHIYRLCEAVFIRSPFHNRRERLFRKKLGKYRRTTAKDQTCHLPIYQLTGENQRRMPLSLAKIIIRAATGQESISQKVRPRLFSNAIQALDSRSIRIVRMISATAITPKLNTRIRRSYDSMLSAPASEIPLAAPANPLAFTCPFYQTDSRTQHECFCLEKRIHHHYKKLKKCS